MWTGQCVLCVDLRKDKDNYTMDINECTRFQLIVCPDGIIANLYGPIEGRRHDSFMLARSRILDQLEHFSFGPHWETLCIYGDPGHPLRAHLQTPFRGGNLTPLQISWNKAYLLKPGTSQNQPKPAKTT